jgi:O-antigen/teichoic acid export membrane protein
MGSIVRGVFVAVASGFYIWIRFSRESIPFRTSRAAVREIGGLVTYTFTARLFVTMAANIDSLLVARFISPESAAMLRITRAPVDICTNLTNRPAAAVAPVVSHLAGSGLVLERRGHLLRLMRVTIWVAMLSCSGLIALNGAFVKLWVGRDLYAGLPVTVALSVGLIAGSAASLLGHLISAMGFIRAAGLIGTGQAAITLVITAAAGSMFGIVGIAAGACVGMCFTVACCLRLLYRERVVTQQDFVSLAKELGLGFLTACCVTLPFLKIAEAKTWAIFTAYACIAVFIFCILLQALSSEFRRELRNLFRVRRLTTQ